VNHRERYIEALTFGRPDKIPFQPGYPRESTLERWYSEGLDRGMDYRLALYNSIGIDMPGSQPYVDHGVSFKMVPQFPETVLEHKDGHYVVQDWMGTVVEISDRYDVSYLRYAKDFVTRKYIKFPVATQDDWEGMKKRYNPKTSERFPEDFSQRCKALKDRDYPVTLAFSGPFWQLRDWCGLETLCIMMIEQPEFVEEMAEFWGDFVSDMLDKVLEGFCPDRVFINEDMAYKAHSMISPAMTMKYLMPAYQKWIPKLKKQGCPIIEIDSDGYIGELIPIWIEAGFNCCSPVEVAAHNDIVEYRKLYGRKMAFQGGIDKRCIAKGGRTIENELQRVIPPLLQEGGFIPSCDHGVPHDISWSNFVEYSRLLARLTGWLK
jgi:uroporphyrinogen-III decarboxylase